MYQIKKEEAVNRILQPLDGIRISNLDPPLPEPVLKALVALDAAVDQLQMDNQWNFHLDGPRILIENSNGEIEIPSDFVSIAFVSWSNGNIWNLTVKGGKVWNRREGTSQIPGQVEVVGTRKFEYDDLPAPMQNYVVEKAKYDFVGIGTHLSAPRLATFAQQLTQAYLAAQKWDSQHGHGVMDHQPPQRRTLRGGYGSNRRWWWS